MARGCTGGRPGRGSSGRRGRPGLTDWFREPGELKPAWWRIIAAAGVLAWFSWLVEVALGRWNPILFGVLSGATLGILGARWTKVALGIVTGGFVGWAVGSWLDDPHLPVVGASVVIVYRTIALGLFRGQPLTEVKGEAVDPSSMPFLVAFAATGPSVGADYLRDLADNENWGFERNPEGGGIVGSFDELAGPDFCPAEVNPLIREFYEHRHRISPGCKGRNLNRPLRFYPIWGAGVETLASDAWGRGVLGWRRIVLGYLKGRRATARGVAAEGGGCGAGTWVGKSDAFAQPQNRSICAVMCGPRRDPCHRFWGGLRLRG